jgi:TrmH family RNA methyltransferase
LWYNTPIIIRYQQAGADMPRTLHIRSADNDFQHVEVLKRNRTKRHQYGEFFVEGVIPLTQAVAHDWPIRSLIYADGVRLSQWAREMLDAAQAETHLALAPELMEQLSDKEDPSELLAVCAMPPDDPGRIEIKDDLLVVVLDRPSNYGNLGTVIRSCDAFGVGGVIVTGHAVDLYDTRTIRASVGSLFALPVLRLPSHNELLSWVASLRPRLAGLQIIGASAHAAQRVTAAHFDRPTILAIGNETRGLSRSYKDLCDHMVHIPMQGAASSLNVACATSVLLYEIDRQRRLP